MPSIIEGTASESVQYPSKHTVLRGGFFLCVWNRLQPFINLSFRTNVLIFIGVCLSICFISIRLLAQAFIYGSEVSIEADILFFCLMVLAGFAYALLFWALPQISVARYGLVSVIVIGLFFRIMFFGSAPISEDDWYRYLWDGAVVSHGVNPYTYPPASAIIHDDYGGSAGAEEGSDLQKLQTFGQAYPDNLVRINYPYVSTIYPPLAQLGFAAAYKISPFNLDAWRLILLIADATSVFLLMAVLGVVGRSKYWALLYWWNPIAIITTFNAGHMDILLAPFLLGAVLLVLKERPYWAAVALAAAVGIKLWPIIMAPVLFGRWVTRPFKLVSIAALCVAATIVFIAPMLISLDVAHSGLTAYAQSWEKNAFLFPLISSGIDFLGGDGDFWARVLVAFITCSVALGLGVYVRLSRDGMLSMLFFIAAVLFFLSPTGYPWYFTWLAIFLPFAPSLGVGLLTLTLPIYYLRFPLQENGVSETFNAILVSFEFLIPLCVIAWEKMRSRA